MMVKLNINRVNTFLKDLCRGTNDKHIGPAHQDGLQGYIRGLNSPTALATFVDNVRRVGPLKFVGMFLGAGGGTVIQSH